MKESEIRERMTVLIKEQNAIADSYPEYDLPDEVWGKVKANDTELSQLTTRLQEINDKKGAFDRSRGLDSQLNQPAAMVHAGEPQVKAGPQTLGERFFHSPEFQSLLKQIKVGDHISDHVKVQSLPFNLKTLITGDSTTSAGAFVDPMRMPGFVPLGRRPLVLRDLVTVGQTQSDAVEFVRVTTETNNATVVAEATATGDGSGAKPESALALEVVTTNVRTISHWIPITRRALADAGQMRTYVDGFLIDGVNQTLETQMMTGSGVGQNLLGLLSSTSIQTSTTTGNLLTLMRRGKRLVQTVGRDMANAFVMNPVDWEALDLLQDNEGRYYFGGPRQVQNPFLWGLPVVEAEACSTGFALVANFKKAVLWDREQANIQVSDSHSDFFIRNMIAILAEGRYAFEILQPNSFVELDLTS